MRLCLLSALIAAAALPGSVDAASRSALAVGDRILVEGPVSSIDLAPMQYDGDGLIVVETRDHGRITVHVPAGERQCETRSLELVAQLRPGDLVRVKGIAIGASDVSICDAGTLLERI